MGCSLEPMLKKAHAEMRNPKLGNIILHCPVLNRQICLWCCLHLADAGDPKKREHMLNLYPELMDVQKVSNRDFDSMFETCSRCRVRY